MLAERPYRGGAGFAAEDSGEMPQCGKIASLGDHFDRHVGLALTFMTVSVFAAEPRRKQMTWDQAIADPAAAHLARPSQVQYDWQEMERAMFIQLDPATH